VHRLRKHHRRSESESNVKKTAQVQKRRAQQQAQHLQYTSHDPTVQEYEYLGLPETASMARCIAAYGQATGSSALRKATCGSCARTDFERVMHPDLFNYSLAANFLTMRWGVNACGGGAARVDNIVHRSEATPCYFVNHRHRLQVRQHPGCIRMVRPVCTQVSNTAELP